ncbi:MAG: hypothetical protein CSB24_05915 [Deltaproteobacteria bacterium]|nr:MAG: hypothetical protein CSB24_05915 [Deltaproteobacteria bacterium]
MFKATFEICENNNCPLYDLNDRFELSDKTLTVPEDKKVCLIFVREITQLLFSLMASGNKEDTDKVYSCSGCKGLIKFKQITPETDINESKKRKKALVDALMLEHFGMTSENELLPMIPSAQLKEFISGCTKSEFKRGEVLIEKGGISNRVYFILRGGVVVEDGPVKISHIGDGEIIGEMSCLGASVSSISVRCSQDTVLFFCSGEDFGRLLEKSSAVQLFMAQLLAKRLSSANRARTDMLNSCMTGRIDEMVPAELLQVFNMHSKTGVLTLEMADGYGSISFREGAIVSAFYNELDDQDAVFAILAEREGIYKFVAGLSPQEMEAEEIGDFMGLLMEGVRRIDEEMEA